MFFALFVLVGIAIATLGSLIGVGGGFVLLPLLIFLFPSLSAGTLTGISLTVVLANSSTAAYLYARRRQVDFRTGPILAVAAAPGALVGVSLVSLISRENFEWLFGLLLVGISFYLYLFRRRASGSQPRQVPILKLVLASFGVGVISSFFGIGGGIMFVPLLIYWLGAAPHVAAATSLFALAIMSLAGVSQHLWYGNLADELHLLLPLVLGTLVGSRVGVAISRRIKSERLVMVMAAALGLIGLYLTGKGLWPFVPGF